MKKIVMTIGFDTLLELTGRVGNKQLMVFPELAAQFCWKLNPPAPPDTTVEAVSTTNVLGTTSRNVTLVASVGPRLVTVKLYWYLVLLWSTKILPGPVLVTATSGAGTIKVVQLAMLGTVGSTVDDVALTKLVTKRSDCNPATGANESTAEAEALTAKGDTAHCKNESAPTRRIGRQERPPVVAITVGFVKAEGITSAKTTL